jgi:hypothetical protein
LETAVAKGQKRPNGEAKKSAAERQKDSPTAADRQIARMGDKNTERKD